MKDQPDFPADEPLMPAHGCQCDLCRQRRQDTAAEAIVTMVETTRNHFATKTKPSAAEAGNPPEFFKESPFEPLAARQSCTPDSPYPQPEN